MALWGSVGAAEREGSRGAVKCEASRGLLGAVECETLRGTVECKASWGAVVRKGSQGAVAHEASRGGAAALNTSCGEETTLGDEGRVEWMLVLPDEPAFCSSKGIIWSSPLN